VLDVTIDGLINNLALLLVNSIFVVLTSSFTINLLLLTVLALKVFVTSFQFKVLALLPVHLLYTLEKYMIEPEPGAVGKKNRGSVAEYMFA
jgi:hypothetical protein